MPLIQPADDLVRESIYERSDAAHEHFRKLVRPIYGASEGIRPELIGSCILLAVDEMAFVATAAHIVDHLDESQLYIGGTVGLEPVQIVGEIMSTEAPDGDRDKDRYDIAFCQVPTSAVQQLGEVQFLDAKKVSHNKVPREDRLYMSMGYPLSKNRGKVDNVKRTIKTVSWRYVAGVKDVPALRKKLEITGDDHFFQTYDKYSKNESGQKVFSVNPRGLSGGGFVDLGKHSSVAVGSGPLTGLLAGMVIERHKEHHSLVAVRIQKVIEAIRLRYG